MEKTSLAKTLAVTIAALLGLAMAAIPAAHATQIINLDYRDPNNLPNWRTTTDTTLGTAWQKSGNFDPGDGDAAWHPYGNVATSSLNPESMMWNCGAGDSSCRNSSGVIDGMSGPTEAFFAFSFNLYPGQHLGELNIIADDFFELTINGTEVMSAVLDEHQIDGQPAPITINLETLVRGGNNLMVVHAMDGYLKGDRDCGYYSDTTTVTHTLSSGDFCQEDRLYEYLYVSGSISTVPEPATLALFAIGLTGLGLSKLRKHST